MLDSSRIAASVQDGTYPRPQLVRRDWLDLSGDWGFELDDADVGLRDGWFRGSTPFGRTITVPFPPESALSGVHETGFHPVVWYRRVLTAKDVESSGFADRRDRVMLRFGAVDYRASVWIDGKLLGEHEGGQTPFSFDITEHARSGADLTLVVRAEDDPHDVSQPRGKQDWLEEPHVIWYHRTTGIWQPVWLEAVPAVHVHALSWMPDLSAGTVELTVELSRRPAAALELGIRLSYGDSEIASQTVTTTEPGLRLVCVIPRQSNGQGYEDLLWSPESPRLIDAHVTIADEGGTVLDRVSSYFGLRSTGEAGGRFLLNDRPYFVRSVLEQGYWPQSHLAAPSAAALRDEVQLIKDLGFNAARIHEKVEDPRFLYWADRLGLLVWGEIGSAFEFSSTAAIRTVREWMEVVERDKSHPCIVTWVPLNESWGVQHISHDPRQLHFAQALYHLTKALDPSRLVVSNDGWEHADSDLLTIHDYATSGGVLGANYRDDDSVRALIDGVGPAGRRLSLISGGIRDKPVMVTEFGGVSFAPDSDIETWGYSTASSAVEFSERLVDLFSALQSSPVLAGYCYTQLTDTLQEANGLTDENRKPKLPIETIRALVRGDPPPQR